MWRWLVLGMLGLAIVIFGFSLLDGAASGDVSASAVIMVTGDTTGFARAIDPWPWEFPRDFGPQPQFQTEWWYYTGNVISADGRHFGYQFTIFRRAIAPEAADSPSEWRSNQLYMAHFAVTDVANQRFYHDERFSRGAAQLAGATIDPVYRVWLEDWEAFALDDDAVFTRITAAMDGVAIDLTLEQVKPPALQGFDGLSPKSAEIGNASYYYSLTRLMTEGTITIGEEVIPVTGASWKDHEFSTSALGADALGWDWFALQFDDGREMMVGQIRLVDGGKDPYFGGLLVHEDGSTRYLPADAIEIVPTATWTSPHTGAVYPAGWTITVDIGEPDPMVLIVTPQVADQELYGGDIAYWEGTIRIEGDAKGFGYAELTGYVDAMTGRF
jgi:predicted secreted hydrolase